MSTSNSPTPTPATEPAVPAPVRLRLTQRGGSAVLDGGWWPRSRDLPVELAELVVALPTELGQVVRVVVSPPDWDPSPRRIPVSGGHLTVGTSPRDDTHVIHLGTTDRTTLTLLVVPFDYSTSQGEEALLAASTPRNAHPAGELLDTVTEHPDVDPFHYWSEDGGSWVPDRATAEVPLPPAPAPEPG